ncbi:MAG: hypothetical protein H7Z14_03010 [Anaerolineae bacterium]|nr:hypothetical protein [Phycisphaerae bacterium]
MDRIAVATILVVLLGVWIHPFLTGASEARNPSADPAAAATVDTTTQPSTQPTTQPLEAQYQHIVGQPTFWRLAQSKDGVWWFLSPQDKNEFLNTVTTVQPYQLGRDKDGPHFVSRDYSPEAMAGEGGDLDRWAQNTMRRVTSIGFKGLGAWSNPAFHKFDIPITRDLNIWTWMKPEFRRFYSPDWAKTAEHAVQVQVTPLKDNINLVGYFLDNELDWGDGMNGPSHYFNNLSNEDPNRREVVGVIQTLWPTVDAFNKEWNTSFKDWNELTALAELPHDQPKPYGRLLGAWLKHLAGDYFRLTTQLVRKYDPNHLILGVRFKGYAPREIVAASRGYTDAQSLNYYVNDGRLDDEMFKMMNEESGQPIILSEYSFHALDGRTGNRNTVGFAAQVLDQQARADGYRLMTTRLARIPYVIGADWFQWSDEPPSGRSSDGEDVNFGVVDVDDNPYEKLATAVKETSPRLNPLHAASARDDGADVYRESFANKPVVHVPFLTKAPILNGELSDWSPTSKLGSIRHSQTIGLERSKLPVPNVYLGWTDAGVYIGMEIFDDDITGAPAKGWWWTRDHVEFWISTQPVASDQSFYTTNDHQFFFVPNDFPSEDGIAGIIGQWHRPGDALTDHLIPHPDVKKAVRVLPDRYVVEMFIPAKALHGWDARKQPQMAFNIHVRNFQHAIDYFWSSPKEVMTQLRPNTWGPMYLDPPVKMNTSQSLVAPTSMPAGLR